MKTIKHRRDAMGITQKQLAEEMEVDRSTVAKWETGAAMPAGAKLQKLAAVLGCSVDDLFKENEPHA